MGELETRYNDMAYVGVAQRTEKGGYPVHCTAPPEGPGETILSEKTEIPLYEHEKNHSPDGFNWGYPGSGPAQLAYAILRHNSSMMYGMDEEESRHLADELYMRFKRHVICQLEQGEDYSITTTMVSQWVAHNTGV